MASLIHRPAARYARPRIGALQAALAQLAGAAEKYLTKRTPVENLLPLPTPQSLVLRDTLAIGAAAIVAAAAVGLLTGADLTNDLRPVTPSAPIGLASLTR